MRWFVRIPKDVMEKIQWTDLTMGHWVLFGIQRDLETRMHQLLSHEAALEEKWNLLKWEYWRNVWIEVFWVKTEAWELSIKLPCIWISEENSLIILNLESIRFCPEVSEFLWQNPGISMPLGEYFGIQISNQLDDALRQKFLSLVVKYYSRSATSWLKQDITPFLLKSWLIENKWSAAEEVSYPVSRRVSRKYWLTGVKSSDEWVQRFREWHEKSWKRFGLEAYGFTPESVHLTLSWVSANSAVVRYIQSRVPLRNISVNPGYFFVNEPEFDKQVTMTDISKNTQAFFYSQDACYAWLWWYEKYSADVTEKLEKLRENALQHPEQEYYVAIDMTTHLPGDPKLKEQIEKLLQVKNIRILLSSSLTKFNHHEPNYHFGIIMWYGINERENEMRSLVATSHGSLSRLWVLQFPRLTVGKVQEWENMSERNREFFVSAFRNALIQYWLEEEITIEDYRPYSYIFPSTTEPNQNSKIDGILNNPQLQDIRGSSFYHESVRVCDVPDIWVGRYSESATKWEFRNTLRISWPNQLREKEMTELWTLLGNLLWKSFTK